jgi:hypothetical protein
MHVHHDAAEAFYVLEGEYLLFLGDEVLSGPAGSFVYIPQGALHGFRVWQEDQSEAQPVLPAAMVGYFDDLSNAITQSVVDPEVLSRIAARYSWRS